MRPRVQVHGLQLHPVPLLLRQRHLRLGLRHHPLTSTLTSALLTRGHQQPRLSLSCPQLRDGGETR